MARGEVTPVGLAVLARAPVPGRAKTRLIPALGPDGAARLHARLVARTVETAAASCCSPVTLWCTPDTADPLFQRLAERFGISLAVQGDGDLGDRMHMALTADAEGRGPALVIGTDCPALTVAVLAEAAGALQTGDDAVVVPALDGGYVLLGVARSDRRLFEGMPWGTAAVLAETRRRLRALGWRWKELDPLWDVDRPEDLQRLGDVSA